ncbi:hypothetical protein A3768_0311 [Ralstonia solanacearum]|nr:hypothetical protein A3768_0311 [Ralstonia solanacearum]
MRHPINHADTPETETLRTALRERRSRCMSVKSAAVCPDSRGA